MCFARALQKGEINMSKRSHGEGTAFRRKDGRWQASLQIDGKRRTVYAQTEREVQAKLRDLQREADTVGNVADPGRRTVNDLFDSWLDNAPDLKPSTVASYRLFLDTYVRPAIGDMRLDRVTPNHLQNLYSNLTPSVGEKVHRVLHRAFAVAVLWRWLVSNPCDHVLKPTYKTQPKTLWNHAELNTFLENTANHWQYPLWVLLISTGCRLGEALALSWDDVGPDGTSVTISRTLHRINGEWVLDTAKTESSARTIALPQVASTVLERQKEQQNTWQEAAGSEWEDWGLVFTGETGKPLFASTIQHALKRECNRLGLPQVTPHGLRHLHASLLLDEGLPLTAVSARLGHANPQITMKIYAHALPGQDKRAADAIGDVLGRSDDAEPDTDQAD
jgi:integrase